MSQPQKLTPAQADKFRQLALPCLEVVLRTARILTRHDQQAEDLTQETMIKAMRSIDSFTQGTDIKAWLLTILRRTFIDALRHDKHAMGTVSLDQTELDVPDSSAPAGEHDAQWTQPAQLLEQFGDSEIIAALKELPTDIRWTLLLVDVEQLDLAAAAQVLQVPVGTVKSRTHRGRGMLRDRLYAWAKERGWNQPREPRHA